MLLVQGRYELHVFFCHLLECVALFICYLYFDAYRYIGPASEVNTYMTYSELYQENSVHNSSQPTEHIDYDEIGDRAQGNTYEVVDPGQDPESTMVNVDNPMYRITTLPASKEPLYEEAQGDQDRSRSNTLTEVSNPMYGPTQMQGGEELEYQETQREVENDLYEDRTDANLDSKD